MTIVVNVPIFDAIDSAVSILDCYQITIVSWFNSQDEKEGFRINRQCDGMGSYDTIWHRRGLKQLGWFDHARRKYVEAQKAAKPSKNKKHSSPVGKADVGLGKINALHRLERQIKDLTPSEKYQQRQKLAKPLLDDLKNWLENSISSAGAENAIRPFAVGRRRWLFCDTPKGAHASAVHYSLVELAKANGLNPDEYYRDIFTAVPLRSK